MNIWIIWLLYLTFWGKCHFVKDHIKYLDHWISVQGVGADLEKVEWSIPQNIRDLRGFLGPNSYYQRFVLNHGNIEAKKGHDNFAYVGNIGF